MHSWWYTFCDLELQMSKQLQETRYRPGKAKGAGSPTAGDPAPV